MTNLNTVAVGFEAEKGRKVFESGRDQSTSLQLQLSDARVPEASQKDNCQEKQNRNLTLSDGIGYFGYLKAQD